MAKQLFSIVVILLLPVLLKAQLNRDVVTDSLLASVSKARNDTTRVNLLCRISKAYYPTDFNKGIRYGNQALLLAQKIAWKKGIERACSSLGTNYWIKYDFIRGQDYYGAALKIALEINDRHGIATGFHDVGICYEAQGSYDKAVEYYNKSAKVFEANNDFARQSGCFSNIAGNYMTRGKYSDAIKYFRKALQISKQFKTNATSVFFMSR